MNDPLLAFDGIGQDFPMPGRRTKVRVLDGISFDIDRGKFVAVIGPSGFAARARCCRWPPGLLAPTRGAVRHHGRKVTTVNTEVGFVPQQAQLFPWKTLKENVELPLLLRGIAAGERHSRVAAALKSVGLDGFENHYPSQLSGGMQKRGSRSRERLSTGPTSF